MILVVREPRVKAPVRWTFAVGNFDDNKTFGAIYFTSQFCRPRQSKIHSDNNDDVNSDDDNNNNDDDDDDDAYDNESQIAREWR